MIIALYLTKQFEDTQTLTSVCVDIIFVYDVNVNK